MEDNEKMIVVYCDLFSWKLGYTNTVSTILLIKVLIYFSDCIFEIRETKVIGEYGRKTKNCIWQ